jgi:hypothetical protein
MDAGDMQIINDTYIRILKKGRRIYKESEHENSIEVAQKLESYSTYLNQMNEKLESILELADKYSRECLTKATEIREYVDINNRYADDPSKMVMAHREMCKGMSWSDITDIEDEKESVLKNISQIVKIPKNLDEYKHEPIMYKDISNIYGKDLGFNCKIPIINKLNEMPSALYWYGGDQKNPKGIYTCLSRKFYVQVPFPNVIDGTKDFNRSCSIKCKYNTVEECLKVRDDLANKYNSDVRDCNFAHFGDKYIKIGTTFRCPNIPRFGNHHFLKDDLKNLPDYDIKMLLMYSLSDILLGSLWFQNQKDTSMVLTNIDTC